MSDQPRTGSDGRNDHSLMNQATTHETTFSDGTGFTVEHHPAKAHECRYCLADLAHDAAMRGAADE